MTTMVTVRTRFELRCRSSAVVLNSRWIRERAVHAPPCLRRSATPPATDNLGSFERQGRVLHDLNGRIFESRTTDHLEAPQRHAPPGGSRCMNLILARHQLDPAERRRGPCLVEVNSESRWRRQHDSRLREWTMAGRERPHAKERVDDSHSSGFFCARRTEPARVHRRCHGRGEHLNRHTCPRPRLRVNEHHEPAPADGDSLAPRQAPSAEC